MIFEGFFEGFSEDFFEEGSFESYNVLNFYQDHDVPSQCVASMLFPICIRFYTLCMKTISKQFFEGFFEAFEDFSHHVIQCVVLMPFPICIRFYTLYTGTIVNCHQQK